MGRNKRTRGHYSIIVGISLTALFGFTAIGVDAGWQRVGMTQVSNAADAGAHAGSLQLDGTREGLVLAVERAHEVATANQLHGEPVELSADFSTDADGYPTNPDIVVGRFDSPGENGCREPAGCWTSLGSVPSETNSYDAEEPSRDTEVTEVTANAVHVAADGEVPTLVGGLAFGADSLAVANYATARLPLEEGVRCSFPLTLPMCTISELGSSACGQLIRLQLSSSVEDNAALSTPVDSTGAATMREMMASDDGACEHRTTEDELTEGTADTALNNGELSSVTSVLADQLAGVSPRGVDTDGDGVPDDGYSYDDNLRHWDAAWGACPATVAEACDTETRGICVGGGSDSLAYTSATHCEDAGGVWEHTCPDAPPNCDSESGFVRRQVGVFDSAAYGMPCDGTNGNPVTGGSFNWNQPVDTAMFASLIIYNVDETSSHTVIDAYLTCTNADGSPHEDLDADGIPDALHGGEQKLVDEDEAQVAIVE